METTYKNIVNSFKSSLFRLLKEAEIYHIFKYKTKYYKFERMFPYLFTFSDALSYYNSHLAADVLYKVINRLPTDKNKIVRKKLAKKYIKNIGRNLP